MSRGVLVMLAACGRLGFGGRADAPDGATESAQAGDAYAPCATPGFVAAGVYPGGTLPPAVALADMDHDGTLDAVIGSRDGVLLYPGRGDGSFGTATASAGVFVQALDVADLDGDGFTDVAIVGSALCVMRNSGGSLGSCVSYATGTGPNAVSVGRLDSGGSVDVVVGNQIDNTIGIYLNDGSAVLGSATIFGTGGTNGVFTALADLDGDGFADFAVTNLLSDNLGIRIGGAAGRPTTNPVTYGTGSHPSTVRAGDLDGDGDLDLVVASRASVDVFINDGSGRFAARVPYPTSASDTGEGRALVLADFDRDGDLDVAASDPDDNSVGLYLNRGDGTFAPVTAFPIGHAPRHLASGDLDGDHRLDLVVAVQGANQMAVLLGTCLP